MYFEAAMCHLHNQLCIRAVVKKLTSKECACLISAATAQQEIPQCNKISFYVSKLHDTSNQS